jgi:hypothetical protein
VVTEALFVPETSPNTPDPPTVSFTRSDEYKTVFSNFFRIRVGLGEITLIFSKIAHTPGILAEPNVVEEQMEVALTWSSIKMLQLHLSSLISGIEQEVGEILIPNGFLASPSMSPAAQREIIRTFGLSKSSATKPTATKEETTP